MKRLTDGSHALKIYIALVRQYFLGKVLSLHQETQYPLLAPFSSSYERNIYMIINQSLF